MLDPIATKYVAFSKEQKTEAGAKKILQETIESYTADSPIFALAVAGKKTNKYIGSIGLMQMEDSFEIYWSINRQFWNKGYGSEAIIRLIKYAQEEIGIKKITAHTHPDNIASYKLAEKCKFDYKGIVKHPFLNEDARLYIIEN
jgi:ribosomal-protein-alanine N-acetyltransferase